MRDVINVKEGDLLWRFYCKWFSIQNKEIIAPKNLCLYFWTAVYGFALWLGQEVKLVALGGIAVLATALFCASVSFSSSTDGVVASVIFSILSLAWILSVLPLFVVGGYRLLYLFEGRVKWALNSVVLIFFIAILCDLARKGILLAEFMKIAVEVLQFMKYVLPLVAFLVIFALVVYKLPISRLDKIKDALETLGAYFIAKKNKVCPPVNPPPGFRNPEA